MTELNNGWGYGTWGEGEWGDIFSEKFVSTPRTDLYTLGIHIEGSIPDPALVRLNVLEGEKPPKTTNNSEDNDIWNGSNWDPNSPLTDVFTHSGDTATFLSPTEGTYQLHIRPQTTPTISALKASRVH